MSRVSPPQDDCPKCATSKAFLPSAPRYVGRHINVFGTPLPDHLEWDCIWCGYTVATLTADAEVTESTQRVAFRQ